MHQHHPELARFIFAKEAGRLLDLTPNAVREMERRGELVAGRIGKVRLFDRAEVERQARQRRAVRGL